MKRLSHRSDAPEGLWSLPANVIEVAIATEGRAHNELEFVLTQVHAAVCDAASVRNHP